MEGTTAPLDYNDWITLDYPSVGQIAQALRDNEIIPIFAAQAFALPAYEVHLQNFVFESKKKSLLPWLTELFWPAKHS